MCSMAVVAFGCFRVTELRNLSVERLEICVSDLYMTSPALVDDIKLESFLVGSADCVRGMAIVAHGKWLPRLLFACKVNTLNELLIDTVMAGGTSLCNIVGVNG